MELGEHIPCDVCRMLLNGRDQYDDHLKGKLHRKNRRRQRSQASAVLGNDDDVHPPKDKAIKLHKTGCLAGPSGTLFHRTRGPSTNAPSTHAWRAMSSGSDGGVERDCRDDVIDQTTNVPTGSHDDTSDSPRSSTPAHTVSTCTADARANCRWLRHASAPETKKPRRSKYRAAAQQPPPRIPPGDNVTDGAAEDLRRHERVFRDMSHTAQRAAVYGGIWKDGRFTVPVRDAILYTRAVEHERLRRGRFPRKLTLQIVVEMAAQAASSAD